MMISCYYENLLNAQNKLSEIIENDNVDRTDLEWEQWVGDTIRGAFRRVWCLCHRSRRVLSVYLRRYDESR